MGIVVFLCVKGMDSRCCAIVLVLSDFRAIKLK